MQSMNGPRVVSIALKIPDNQAYTALATLRRLGVDVERVERAEIVRLYAGQAPSFNPNKHVVRDVVGGEPSPGQLWIEEMGQPDRYVAWSLFDAAGVPAARTVLESAAHQLLCNPAIEKAHYAR
jgi:phosphoribosylformylglycinamidine (FGAM) synthase PurS component